MTFLCHLLVGSSVDELYNKVQKQLTLFGYPKETTSILSRAIYFYFVCKTMNFLLNACQRLVSIGIPLRLVTWPKSLKGTELLPRTKRISLQASHKLRSIIIDTKELNCHNTRRGTKRRSSHTRPANQKLFQAIHNNVLPPVKKHSKHVKS